MSDTSLQTHDQVCSSCTLGSKSQWTLVYTVTLIAGWVLYLFKVVLEFMFIGSMEDVSMNFVVSFVAWVVSLNLIVNDASADDNTCSSRSDTKKSDIGKFHRNASFLLVSLCVGFFSIVSAIYRPKDQTRPFFTAAIVLLFCIIFLIYAATSQNSSLFQCDNFLFSDEFVSSSSSSSSSSLHDCSKNLVAVCGHTDAMKCRNQMIRNNHKSFSLSYNPTTHFTWNFLLAKPNQSEEIRDDIKDALLLLYMSPFQVLLSGETSLANDTTQYVKAYSLVEWVEKASPPDSYQNLVDSLGDVQKSKLLDELNNNNGMLIHEDVKGIATLLKTQQTNIDVVPYFINKWCQKEIYYVPINVGSASDQQTILQRVESLPVNASPYAYNMNSYILSHHKEIVGNEECETEDCEPRQLSIQQWRTTNNSFHPLHGFMSHRGAYINPVESAVIEKVNNKFFDKKSFVELKMGNKSIFLQPGKGNHVNTMVTCNTFDKRPTSVDIKPLPLDTVEDDTAAGNYCTSGSKHETIYYESKSVSGSDRSFLLNISLTSLFASVAFLRPAFVSNNFQINIFSLIAFFQMFLFFYIGTGYYGTDYEDAYFWVAVIFALMFTCVVYVRHSLKGKGMTAIITKSLSAISSILFNVFLLCHLVIQMSESNNERESNPWFWLSCAFLLLFLLVPFDEDVSSPTLPRADLETSSTIGKSYFKKIRSTMMVRVFILCLYIICTSIFSNNYLDIAKSVRLTFVILLSITIGLLTFPRFESVIDEDNPSIYDIKNSGVAILIISIFFTLNNLSHSFSNYTSELETQKIANNVNLYNSTSTLLMSLIALITTQLIFGKQLFYIVALLCIVPFLTLYQYESVKKASDELCSVRVAFGNNLDERSSQLIYNATDCGQGSSLNPDVDCTFARQKIHEVQMLDTHNKCQVYIHDEIGQNSQKTVWQLKKSLKFDEKCNSNTTAEQDACTRSFSPAVNSSAVTVLERCGLKLKFASRLDSNTNIMVPFDYYLRVKRERMGIKGLQIFYGANDSDFEAVTENSDGDVTYAIDENGNQISPSVWKNFKLESIEISGGQCMVIAYEGENWNGPHQKYTETFNEVDPPRKFNSYVVEKYDENPVWPEILPLMISGTSSTIINILWRLIFYISLFLIPFASFRKGIKSPVVFLIAFLSACLFGILSNNGLNTGMGLGGKGLTGTNPGYMDPDVFGSLLIVATFFGFTTERMFFTTGSERVGMVAGSAILFAYVFVLSASVFPIFLACGIVGVFLVPNMTSTNKILALCLPLVTLIALITSWFLGKGRLPIGANGYMMTSANGEIEYGNYQTPTGEFWNDLWQNNAHFFINLGYNIKDFFTGVTFQKMSNEFENVIAKLDDDSVKSHCNSKDSNNPLCVASKRNKCQFSHCISPPDPIRMSDFDDSYDQSEIKQLQKSRCDAHKIFHTSALKAVSEKRASGKQKYCVQYHKNDDCSNICKDFWKNDSDPVTKASLAKLESRLKVIDDSVLELTPEEWVQLKREELI